MASWVASGIRGFGRILERQDSIAGRFHAIPVKCIDRVEVHFDEETCVSSSLFFLIYEWVHILVEDGEFIPIQFKSFTR